MFRFTEDEFLRKGDYSRNCLTYEEEEAEALKLAAAQSIVPPHALLSSKVIISAGGKCTEQFVRQVVAHTHPSAVWRETCPGVHIASSNNNQVVAAVVHPESSSHSKSSSSSAVEFERQFCNWLFASVELSEAAASSPVQMVVFGSIPLAQSGAYGLYGEEDGAFQCRFLHIPEKKKKKTSGRLLEKGRLVTGLPAAVMERALLLHKGTKVTCCLVPREPVLALESMESLLLSCTSSVLEEEEGDGGELSKALQGSFHKWARTALVEDEKLSRLSEPEGMFM